MILIEITFGGQPQTLVWRIPKLFEADFEYETSSSSCSMVGSISSYSSLFLFLFSGSIISPIALLIGWWLNPSATDVLCDGVCAHADPSQSDTMSYPSLKQTKMSAEYSTQKPSLIGEPYRVSRQLSAKARLCDPCKLASYAIHLLLDQCYECQLFCRLWQWELRMVIGAHWWVVLHLHVQKF